MSFVSVVRAARALGRAQFAIARALIDDSISFERASAFEGVIPFRLATAVLIDAHVGDQAALTREVAELRDLCSHLGWTQLFATADRAEGLQALGDGRLEVALNKLEPLAEHRLLGSGPWDVVPMGRADLVEALVRSGERARAAEVASSLTRILGPSSDPIALALVSRSQALVNHGEGADEAFVSAIADFRRAGLPFEEARTRLLRGELLRRERRVREARRELRTAAAAFERMEAVPWARQATDELRATGAAVQPRPADPWASLTPQERRVAEAVAAGDSDRQVAAELFLSHRTVSYHLSSVYRKLGVTNRTALASRLADWTSAGAGVG
jgi:DNA-binding CsgD family transcriptional regulator